MGAYIGKYMFKKSLEGCAEVMTSKEENGLRGSNQKNVNGLWRATHTFARGRHCCATCVSKHGCDSGGKKTVSL